MGAVDGHHRAVLEILRGGAGADDARQAEFAGHDRGVARHAATVGHQGHGPAHGGQPVRVGHLGYQHLAVLHARPVLDVHQHPHHTRGRAGNGRQALQQHLVLFCGGLAGPVQRGDRAGLDDVGRAVGDRPLGVLRAAGVLFAADRDIGDRPHLVVAEDLRLGRGVVEFDALILAVRAADDLERLVTHSAGEDFTVLLGDDVGVGFHRTGHHHLALAERALDHHPVGGVGGRVGGERHARTFRGDHQLHNHRHRRVGGEAARGAVGDHPRAEQRRPAVLHRLDQVLLAAHIGERLVHAREGRVRAVLAGSRRPRRNIAIRAHRPVGDQDALADLIGHSGLQHNGFHLRAHLVEPAGVQRRQQGLAVRGVEFVVDTGGLHRLEIGVAQHHEPGWHRQSGGHHLAHVGALAAGLLGIGHAQIGDVFDVSHGISSVFRW